MKKKIRREVRFDAMTLRTARDIHMTGPVMNLGDAPQRWRVHVTVVVQGRSGQVRHHFTFTPDSPVALRALHGVIKQELAQAEYDKMNVVSLPVRAEIIEK